MTASAPITVASVPPDLVISHVTVPSGGETGHQVLISWQVTNTGQGDTAASTWSDSIILSASSVLGASDNIVLATVAAPSGPLAAGARYTQDAAVELPLALSGPYTLFVVTDPDPLTGQPPTVPTGYSATPGFTVTQVLPALEVSSVAAPADATAGTTVAVTWMVTNAGQAATDATYWYDELTVTGPGLAPVVLAEVKHVNALGAGGSYTASATVTLPATLSAGSYTFGVTADVQGQVTELDHAGSTSSSAPVAVTAAPMLSSTVDVSVGNVVVPAEITSGQAVTVSYMVTNTGTATSPTFYDAVWLSRSPVLGGGSDIYLGYVNNDALAAGVSRVNTDSFAIPTGLSGQLYVIVQPNAGDIESAGTAVVGAAAVQVDLPAVVDLAVASVTVPETAAVGAPVTISYTVTNQSANALPGSWTDALYLSADGTWNPSDPLVGMVVHAGGIGADGSYTGTLTATLPGVLPGPYEVVVRTNVLSQSAGTNATGASADPLVVTVPSMALGAPVSGTLANDHSAYYQFTVTAGQTVNLQLTSNDPGSINNIYARYGSLPTQGQFDATSSNPSVADPDAVIQITRPGTYYVELTGDSVPGTETYGLSATALSFTLSHITPDYGSNLGSVTLTLDGAQFKAGEVVTVRAVDGAVRAASTVTYVNSTEVYATFDLRGLAVGAYDVSIGDGTNSAKLAQAFQVSNGPAGNVSVNIVLPEYLRSGQNDVVTVTYANTGQTDITAPLIDLSTVQAAFNDAGAATGTGDVEFLATSTSGPAGILQPGVQGSVSFSYTPINPQPHEDISFAAGVVDTTTAGDWISTWTGLQSTLQPPTVDAADWKNVWAAFTSMVGTTSASVDAALSSVATELGQVGQATDDLSTLIGFELLQATGTLAGTTLVQATDIAPGSSAFRLSLTRYYSGTLLDRDAADAFGDGWVTNYDVRAVTDASGNVYVESPTALHIFTLQADGSYAAQPGDGATLTAVDGLYRMADGSGDVEQFRADGKLASTTDGNGNVVSLTYTAAGVLSKVTSQTSGEAISFTSDAQGSVTSATDSRGETVTYGYSSDGVHLLSTTCAGGTTSYSYAAPTGVASDNALTSVTNPDGRQQVFTYNAQGWVASTFSNGGADLQTYTYDDAGRMTVTNALRQSTTELFGSNGAVAQVQDALGNVTAVQSSTAGEVTGLASAGGSTVSATYDASGDLTGLTDPLGGSVSASYVPGTQQLSTLTTQLGSQTHYTYDAAGDVTGVRYQDGSGNTYAYSPSGLLTSSTDADGNTTAYTYDAAGNLTKQAFSDGTADSYTYDARGNLLTATAPSGATSYTYDTDNRLTSVTNLAGQVESYTFNSLGQLVGRTEPDGSVTQYSYTAQEQLAEVQDGSGNLITKYTYDAAGQLTGTVDGNGATTTYTYDADGRTTGILNRDADGSVAAFENYTYNANSLVTQEATNQGAWNYGYDAAGELTSAVFASTNPDIPSQDISYTYDAAGNRVSQTVNNLTTTYSINALNQFTQIGGTNYTYDADGRLVAETDSTGTTTFGYNAQGQLTAENGPSDSNAYVYDALGNLVSELQNGVMTTFVNDPLSMTVDGQNLTSPAQAYNAQGAVNATYGYGLGLTSMTNASGTSYFNADLTGNLVGVSGPTGTLLASSAYSPFGLEIGTTNSLFSTFGYSGLYGAMTTQGGFVLMSARAYDPFAGRFVSQDPIGVNGDINLYRYANNEPLSSVDPTGHDSILAHVGGAALGAIGGATSSLITQGFGRDANGHPTPIDPAEVARSAFQGGVTGFFSPAKGLKSAATALGSGLLSGVAGKLGKYLIPSAHAETMFITPDDPNGIFGPSSFGAENLVSAQRPLAYEITFENASTATAPTQNVIVTQQLDTNLDWSTFRLTGFGFDNLSYTLSGNSPFYTAQIDLTATKGYIVDVSAGVDVSTGVVTWHINTIDPRTGLVPAEPTVGFLPINDANNSGNGFISYTVQSKAGVQTGDVVGAQATVVFDNQPPINTSAITDTLVVDAPISVVQTLPAQTDSTTFEVSWSGKDVANGPGISSYTILVSEDGGPAMPWLTGTTQTNALYTGQDGHSYAFSSVATDNVGITEAQHAIPDTTVLVGAPAPTVATGQLIIGHGLQADVTALVRGLVRPGLPGDTETVTALVAANGSARIGTDGALTYTAPSGGPDTINVTVADQRGESATGTIAVIVDSGPSLTPDTVAKVGHGQTVQAATVAPGLVSDMLMLAITAPGQGSLALANGVLTYTAPTAGGADSVGYTVIDQYGDNVSGIFSTAVDDGPEVRNGTLTIGHNQAEDMTTLLAGLATPDLQGDAVTIASVSALAGTVAVTGSMAEYTAPNSGTDTINYTVADQLGDTATGTVAVTVDGGPTLAAATIAKVGHGQTVQVGTVTPGLVGDTLNLTTTMVGLGMLSLANGVLSYAAPITGGADGIGYTVTDHYGDKISETFSTTVDSGPTTRAGALTIGHGQTASLTALLAGLVTPGLPGDTETVTAVSARTGTASLGANGIVSYVAPAAGVDTVSFTVTDQFGNTNTGMVKVNVDNNSQITTPSFTAGEGALEVDEDAGALTATTATLQLYGISESQLTIGSDGAGNVVLTDGISGDEITIDRELNAGNQGSQEYGVSQIYFPDGSVFTRIQLARLAQTVSVSAGSSATISSSSGSLTVEANANLDLIGDANLVLVRSLGSAIVYGNSDTLYEGTGSFVTLNGNNDVGSATGTGKVNINGANDTASVADRAYVGILTGSTGAIADISDGTVQTNDGVTASIVGSGNTIAGGANSTYTVYGNSDTLYEGTGSFVTLNGNNDVGSATGTGGVNINGANDTASVADRAYVGILTGSTGAIADISDGTVQTNDGVTASIVGSGNTIAGGANSTYTVYGNSDTLYEGTGSFVTLNGNNDVGSATGTGGVNINGANDTASVADRAYVGILTGSTGAIADISDGTVQTNDGVTASIVGSGNTIAGGANSTYTVYGNSDTLYEGTGSFVTLNGNNDVGSATGTGGVNINGANDTASVADRAYVGILTGSTGAIADISDGTVQTNDGVTASIVGSGNTIAGGANSTYTVYGNSDTLYEGTGSFVTLNGNNDVGSATGTGGVNINGANDTASVADRAYVGILTGSTGAIADISDGTVQTNDGVTASIVGSGNTIAGGANSTYTVYGNSDTLYEGTGSFVTLNGNNDVGSATGTGGVNINGANDTASVADRAYVGILTGSTGAIADISDGTVQTNDGVTASIVGSGNTIAGGANSTYTVYGNSDTLYEGTGSFVTLNGNNDVGSATGTGGVNINGANDTASVADRAYVGILTGSTGAIADISDGTVQTNDGVTASIVGSGNTIAGGANSTYTVYGNSNTLYEGSGSFVTINGNGDTVSSQGDSSVTINGTDTLFIDPMGGGDIVLVNQSGNIIQAGAGTDTITDMAGANTFVLPAASRGFDMITGFSETNGDLLDLRTALSATAWDHQANTLATYLKVTDGSSGTTLSIAATGNGSATAIALLNGSGNLGLADLISHNSLKYM